MPIPGYDQWKTASPFDEENGEVFCPDCGLDFPDLTPGAACPECGAKLEMEE
jgi:DNA-directed RNA polymerase subunit RPC12/RpoP